MTAALILGGCASPFGPPGPRPLPPPGVPSEPGSAETAPAETGSTAPRPAPPIDGGRLPGDNRPRGPAPAQPSNQAAVALLDASREASAAGDFGDAAITLERAVAIDPNNALLWIELAEVRWRQGDRAQADSLARKALTLAGNDRRVIMRAEQLIGRR